jgi:hypothetical protein
MRGVVGLVVVLIASATPTVDASPAAEKLFRDGKQLMKDGKLAEACDAFRKSQELEPRSGTLLNLGDCEEKRGRLATAWEAFVASRALANQRGEPRVEEAEKRAAAVAPKLPYLTVRVAAFRPYGFVVKRNGKDVPAAELDHEVPIDPGRYVLEALAPDHVAWQKTVDVEIGKKLVVEIPALAVDRATTTVTPPAANGGGTVTPPVDTAPSTGAKLTGNHKIGVGVAVGGTTDSDLIFGVRIPVQLAPVGNGAIRALPSVFYAKFEDPADRYHVIDLYAIGLGVEYVLPIAPTFFIAAGAGVGIDIIDDNYGSELQQQAWGAGRVSPTLKIGKSVDIGLHIQLVATKDRVVGLGELGVDYFFW